MPNAKLCGESSKRKLELRNRTAEANQEQICEGSIRDPCSSAAATGYPSRGRSVQDEKGLSAPVDTAVGVPMAAGVRYPFFGVLLSPMIASVALTSGRWPSSTRSGCAAIPSTARCRRQRNALMGRDVMRF